MLLSNETMAADLAGIFEISGEDVVYQSNGGEPVTVPALVERGGDDGAVLDGGDMVTKLCTVTVWQTGDDAVPEPNVRRDHVTVDGLRYAVVAVQHRDAVSATVRCEAQVPISRAGRARQIGR